MTDFKTYNNYPKFIGKYLSGCNYHYRPSDIFLSINKGRSTTEHLVFYDMSLGAIDPMKEENTNVFWEKCQREFPFSLEQLGRTPSVGKLVVIVKGQQKTTMK